MRALLLVALMVPAIGLAQRQARPSPLEARRLALVGLGVPADDPALVQGERAALGCARGTSSLCEIAEAAYALAAARTVHAELLEAFAALGETPPEAPSVESGERSGTLARLRRDRELLEARILAMRRALEARAARVDPEAARALAAALAAEEAARASTDDDAYRARRARASDRDRATMRRQAALALERGLPRRIDALRDEVLAARAREALARALTVEDVDTRLGALLEVDAMLVRASRSDP